MHGEGFFYQAFVCLAAAVISVPVAKRLGLGSVLGYLIAGVAIGPFGLGLGSVLGYLIAGVAIGLFGLGLIGEEDQNVMQFAEVEVVMMLFLVGLELALMPAGIRTLCARNSDS
ncbi:MAG: hypothetical protein AMS18_02420 [Gemmatimonas sp. SG8_17]|nr:MAG: hypothetical protein AMS18_02420 [Gemmatimonas sp. SG8_17]